ncbi:MAG: response regulator, partial [Rhodospirillaceae bacterium]|nr:response regulator [Rhodospirillaceae bacterium]
MPDIMHIAVIDDDESMRLSLAGLLRSLGHAVRGFASAEEFLAAEADFTCILSDLRMPGLGGLGLLERMRSSGRATPVILMTAFADAAAEARAARAGATGFLRKPFDAASLLACFDKLP